MRKLLLKLQYTLLIAIFITVQSGAGISAFAQEISAPQAPETPVVSSTAPDSPQTPEAPSAPSSAVQNSNNSGSEQSGDVNPAPQMNPTTAQNNSDQSTSQQELDREAHKKAAAEAFIANYNQQNQNAGSTNSPTGVVSNGNTGNTAISTGNGTNGANIATNTNNNLNSAGQGNAVSGSTNPGGASVVNSGNGTGSSNNSIANNNSANIAEQNNSAVVKSNLDQATVTGTNKSSFNNGDTTLTTGDSNTSGTIMNVVNTNINGVMISEFNVADDHKGDIILTPEAFLANCISGCGVQNIAVNSGNGANSQNSAISNSSAENGVFQTNDAAVGNSMTLSANSGDNTSSFNTNGNTTITTGDANVSANVLNFVNNNISGNVIFGVVNIYGTLEGDIILPDYTITNLGSQISAQNSGNGALSQNDASSVVNNSNSAFQNNDADIVNNLVINGQTGNNSSGFTTDGDTTVKTGQTNAQANVLNVTNTNTQNAPVWLVLINEAGKWFGQLLGVPEGQNFTGSDGVRFEIGSEDQLIASNNSNGAGSVNNVTTTTNNSSNTNQNNTAAINNTLNLSANTGGNRTDFNTGGNNNINTGNANIIANIINFANNNITGNNPLFVTVVNVFDKWIGDFVAPGQKKKEKQPENKNNDVVQTAASSNSKAGNNAEQSQSQGSDQKDSLNSAESAAIAPKNINAYGIFAAGRLSANEYEAMPTTTIAGVNTDLGKVAGASSVNSRKLLANASINTNFSKVAGSKAIRVNLAWLILLIPAGVVFLIIKNITGKIIYRKNYYE